MKTDSRSIRRHDKLLFTPGPLTTSPGVKQAMLRDLGSRDFEFISVIREVRRRLLALAGVSAETHTAVPMQGSGTFALEAVVSSVIPPEGKLLVLVNGAYGTRLVKIARVLGVDVDALELDEDEAVDPGKVAGLLAKDEAVSHVACCHCETTSGVVNPVEAIGAAVRAAGRLFFVDAMSSFGAVPVNMADAGIDYLVSSSNKCIEGVPGFAFVLARLQPLFESEGCARSVVLDLLDQHRGLDGNGQFRFTPPTHTILAFHQALIELDEEGGVAGRAARYRANYETLVAGMRRLGFREFLDPGLQGYIITSFHYPDHPKFDFEAFYGRLNESGYVIYPGKVGAADCFRIGTIGRLFPSDVEALLAAVERHLREMGVALS